MLLKLRQGNRYLQANPPRLALDIAGQPATLARVMQYQTGAGRVSLFEAARLIRAAPRAVIIGMGASLNASIPFENLLCANGKDALVVEAGELFHYRGSVYQEAVFVVVSRSGESVEIARWLSANAGRAPVIGVTNVPDSTLARQATVVLDVHSLLDEMVAIQTYSATLVTLYLLGMTTLNRFDDGCREVEALLPEFAQLIVASLTALHDWDNFLEPQTPVYTLGRGPSFGSALQGALLFGEVAKSPAVGMPVASFRHGPIEVVDHCFKALLLAPHGPTRLLNLALAADIVRFGGSVRLIGPPADQRTAAPWIATPRCSDMLAPLVEVVPLQLAAMRLAELRGIPVGRFRFTPQVTVDEGTITT